MSQLAIVFNVDGSARALHSDMIPLGEIGRLKIERASTIEFNEDSQLWEVKLPGGEVVFTDASRQECLDWEHLNLSL